MYHSLFFFSRQGLAYYSASNSETTVPREDKSPKFMFSLLKQPNLTCR